MKFKVWDEGNLEWATDFTLAPSGELLCDGGTTLFIKDNMFLCMGIGLVDRHNQPIYHKDILQHYHTNESYIIEHIESEARFALRKIGCNTECGYKLVQDNMHMFSVLYNDHEIERKRND